MDNETIRIPGTILQNLYCGNCRRCNCFGSYGDFLIVNSSHENSSILENQNLEKNSNHSKIVKKYSSMGFEIYLSKNYGSHIGIKVKNILI